MRFAALASAMVFSVGAACFPAMSQDAAKDAKNAALQREQHRERINDNVIFLMGGQLGGGYLKLAHDVSVAIQDEQNLRVLPVVGGAAVQNIRDLLFLKGMDLALTTVQALNLLKDSSEIGASTLGNEIAYVAALFPDEMHVVVRKEVNSLRELSGQKVSFNNAGSQTAMLSPKIFDALGISVQAVNMPQDDAIEKIKTGELAASVCICPKPISALPGIAATAGLKLIGVEYVPALQEGYLPAELTSEDYANLIPKGETVQTVATQTILVTYNWPKNSRRYRKVEKFVEAFFLKFGELMKPPRNPVWKTVNLAATVKGWPRFPAAQEMVDKLLVRPVSDSSGGNEQIRAVLARVAPNDTEKQNRLYQEFQTWRDQQARSR